MRRARCNHHAVGPVHGAVGVVEKIPLYSSGYGQPDTVVMPAAVSWSLCQPSTDDVTEIGASVNVAGGRVTTLPVAVYVGSKLTSTSAPEMLAGGHVYRDVEDATMVEVSPPVCHAE